jgi:hypothetical protein
VQTATKIEDHFHVIVYNLLHFCHVDRSDVGGRPELHVVLDAARRQHAIERMA